ncbi:external alternative NAD(P)H-ubiquinone oxidoreductase B2, mitochondrial [Cyclospora cayetanensis]|uniref:NADH:ubiquinone reductase (non-electrogenic) n=1 Tax=Cyclospora cayetanensis TaxID=88456 RepID=A0A6P6RQ13_9EIME|nr:external alternative NAD(P)H-ubiquinone oxidoreductase B2, mitochondrial [Cyclospora cayetanensis]
MPSISTLRYLGALAGASAFSASTAPAHCKEQHRSSGVEKLRMQQHREAPHSPDVAHLLASPPPLLGLCKEAEWCARNMLTALQLRLRLLKLEPSEGDTADTAARGGKRKRVVVAGGGWASASFVRKLDPRQFEVVWISPQDHFSYTPLLPAVCGGSLPVAACTAKLRELLSFGGNTTARGQYHRAFIDAVDLNSKKVICRPTESPGGPGGPLGAPWEEPFDYLVLAVGSSVNTFNIRGVREHALFLRTAEDAQRVRARIGACLEAAASPKISQEARERLLTFVVVGAGPSGVEAAAEIKDYLSSEGKRLYPHISQHFRVLVVEMGPAPLPMYDSKVQEGVKKTFKRSGVELHLNTQVIQVSAGSVTTKRVAAAAAAAGGGGGSSGAGGSVTSAGGAAGAGGASAPSTSVESIPTNFVLWASGVRPTELATSIAKGLAAQNRPQRLLVDPSLRVLGTEGLFALGDCCTIAPPLLADHAQQLFEMAVADNKPGSAGTDWLLTNGERLSSIFPQLHPKRNKLDKLAPKNHLDLQRFTELLQEIDKRYVSPAPTAQNARQEGQFLALVFNCFMGPGRGAGGAPETAAPQALPAFVENWKGSLCFLGSGTAALQLPFGTYVGGFPFTLLWKLVYLQLQPSVRSCWRCCEGWIQSAVFGRDIACTIPPPPKEAESFL